MTTRWHNLRFEHIRAPRRASAGKNVTQMHYARQGIITPEMEFVAIRENLRLMKCVLIRVRSCCISMPGRILAPALPDKVTAEFVRAEVAPGPGHYPSQYQPPGTGADDYRPQFPRQGQYQYW